MPARFCPHCGHEGRTVICERCGGNVPIVSPTAPSQQHITRTRTWVVVVGGVVLVAALVFLFVAR